jgi:hypothetical protein
VLILFLTQLPAADEEVLSAGITGMGGQWRSGLTKDVTHLFATQSGSEKYLIAMDVKDQTQIKVLLPHWFDDVVKLGLANLDTAPYEWPEPRFLQPPQPTEKGSRMVVSAEKRTLFKTAVLSPEKDHILSPEKDVWKGTRILLSQHLDFTDGRRETAHLGIRRTGGIPVCPPQGYPQDDVRLVEECQVFITNHTGTEGYKEASAFLTCFPSVYN